MRYQYVVILKKDSERATDLLSILLCLYSAFSFLFFAISPILASPPSSSHSTYIPPSLQTWFLIGAALVLLVGSILNLITSRRNHTQVRYRYWLLIAAVGWLGMTALPWMAAFFFLLAFLEYQTKRPLEIGFDKDRIVINTLLARRYAWTDFNNIILKDGLLTLDFKSNRLLQKEVADDEDEDDADEEEFNMYCRERLSAANR
ncbi:MAG TPA: hypothetical protein VI233_16930 [Puia sp.]